MKIISETTPKVTAEGVFLDLGSVDREDLDLTELQHALPAWQFHENTAAEQVQERIDQASVVVSNKVPLLRTTLEASPFLRLICVAATGTNNVDLEAAHELGIAVCNVRGYATPSVVQHVFALILALSTRLCEYRDAVHTGRWQQSSHFCLLDFPIQELAGQRLGVVGYGELGQAVSRLGQAFGMEVLVAERRGEPLRTGRVSFEEILERCDVLSLHCPLTQQTQGLIGTPELRRLKPKALLINTARGGIVNEAALATALREGRIGGAGIDVLTREPPREDNPLLADDLPNLIVTPHSAWASRESRQRLIHEIAQNIRAFGNGTPRNLVP